MREYPEVFKRYDIRGEVPGEIDAEMVYRLGKCLADYWDNSGKVVLGRDGRKSSPEFYKAVSKGLTEAGCDVVKLGIATTDMVSVLVKDKEAVGGVEVTASHMPPEYGGLKPINLKGRILSNPEMEEIKEIYLKKDDFQAGNKGTETRKDGREVYMDRIRDRYREIFANDFGGMKLVVDPGNGVGSVVLPDILRELNAEVDVINGEIDPDFSGRGPLPEEGSLEQLKSRVREKDADMGIATDGDADRVMFVNEKGGFVPGDHTLSIFARKYLETGDKVVCSVNTSQTVEQTVEQKGGELIETPVGAVFTALKCLEENIAFGGQPNGHLMDTEFTPYDSGTLFGVLMPGLVQEAGKTLSELQAELPEFHLQKTDVEVEDKQEKMEEIKREVRKRYKVITEIDGIKFLSETAQILVRPSGSSPLLRVRCEGETREDTEKGLQETVELIRNQ